MRDQVEIDYADKLSSEQKAWLASFNEAHYGGKPICLEDILQRKVTQEEKRKHWREIKRYQRDTGSQPLRQDITSCFYNSEDKLNLAIRENTVIEMIDKSFALERIELEELKLLLRSKEKECQKKKKRSP